MLTSYRVPYVLSQMAEMEFQAKMADEALTPLIALLGYNHHNYKQLSSFGAEIFQIPALLDR